MDGNEIGVRIGVADLLTTYQLLADSGRVEAVLELFEPDAVFIANTVQRSGRSEIGDFFRATGSAFVEAGLLPARHHLSTIQVAPTDDGNATTYSCFQLVGQAGLDHWGTYRDVVRFTHGSWRFARRVTKVEGHVAGSPVANLLGMSSGHGS